MRIAIVSIDSPGGVQPYLALARGLRGSGHDVRMIVPANAVAMVTREGIEARAVEVDIQAMLTAQAAAVTRSGARPDRGLATRHLGDWMRQAFDACAGVELVMAGATGAMIARSVAEARGARYFEAHLHPIGPPTTAFPSVFLPGVPPWLGGPGRWATHLLTGAAMTLPVMPAIRRARREILGLPASGSRPDPGAPVLYGYSPHVLPPPPSWSPRRHVTGYWTLPPGPSWSPPAELVRFLDAGPPPVCIGFGSMPTPDPAGLATLLVNAARAAGQRVVLLGGWAGLTLQPAEDVIIANEAPHEWLFPRCAMVVHHGGAGTTGAAIRAGKPMVIVAHGADQPFWAAQVQRLGIGPAPIPRPGLTQTALTAALQPGLHDQDMRERAATLGHQVRAENGVAAAVEILDRYLGSTTPMTGPAMPPQPGR